jgi:hypothetical protein
MMEGIVYLVNKRAGTVEYAGELPDSYGNIPGLGGLNYETLSDLAWAKHFGMGFLTEADALRVKGITQELIDSIKQPIIDGKWMMLNGERSMRIDAVRWRVDRHNDEKMMGKTPTEDVTPILEYIDAIRNIKATNPDPFNVTWPQEP